MHSAILSQRRLESASRVEMPKETPHADALKHDYWFMSRLPQKYAIPSIFEISFFNINLNFKIVV